MNFQIMQHTGGREFIPAMSKENKPLIYDDAKKAARIAAKLTSEKGVKFQPRPVVARNEWHERERKRFQSGEYKPVMWIKENWWKEIDGHFAHVAMKDPTRVAYTPDAAKGEADRQTATLPGKYLQQYFSNVLSADQVRFHAMQHSTTFETNELKFAKTVEEIEHVYKNGPSSSCFAGTTKGNLYASGDFAVAYIENAKGEITARAICAIERKVYPYLYGDKDRLKAALHTAGYKLSMRGADYVGLRLLKEWHWRGFYPDWDYNARSFPIDPKDNKYLIVKA